LVRTVELKKSRECVERPRIGLPETRNKEQEKHTLVLGGQLAKHKAVLSNYIYLERMVPCRRAYNMRVEVGKGGRSDSR
jgi:hypothetical protein